MKGKDSCTVILTVGNERQKKLCDKLLAGMDEKLNMDILTVSDDEFGCRIGSGGAVLKVLERFYQEKSKLIIVNSGGKSKRSVNYAVRGKAFANLSVGSDEKVLLELILSNARQILSQAKNGAIVCCSDILVDTGNIGIALDSSVGFCAQADIETGTRHGVMFPDEKGFYPAFSIRPKKMNCSRCAPRNKTGFWLIRVCFISAMSCAGSSAKRPETNRSVIDFPRIKSS